MYIYINMYTHTRTLDQNCRFEFSSGKHRTRKKHQHNNITRWEEPIYICKYNHSKKDVDGIKQQQWNICPPGCDLDAPRGYTYIHPYIHTSIHPYIHTSMHPCIHASMHPCIHACMQHTYIHTYMHPCIHASMNPCMHTCIHAYMHTCIHAYIHIYIHTCIHAYMHTYIFTYIHTCIHAYMHTCIDAYMHTCIHAYMHRCIHAYMHTYIHTYIYIYIYMQVRFHRNIATSSLAADCNVPQRPPAIIRSFTSIQMIHTHTACGSRVDEMQKKMRWKWPWNDKLPNQNTRRGTQKRTGKEEHQHQHT